MPNYVLVIIAAAVSLATALITVAASRPEVRADVTQTLTDISLSLIQPQADRIDALNVKVTELTGQVCRLETENRGLHKWSQILFSQVVEHGGNPVPFKEVI